MKLIPLEPALAPHYGEVYRELRRKGRAMSQVDMMLAALVRHTKWTLLTADRDYEALPDIPTESWLV